MRTLLAILLIAAALLVAAPVQAASPGTAEFFLDRGKE